jgi:hypothetical protein
MRVTMHSFDGRNGNTPGPAPEGYVWYRNHYHLLPTLDGANATSPGTINDDGQIVGTVTTAADDTRSAVDPVT